MTDAVIEHSAFRSGLGARLARFSERKGQSLRLHFHNLGLRRYKENQAPTKTHRSPKIWSRCDEESRENIIASKFAGL